MLGKRRGLHLKGPLMLLADLWSVISVPCRLGLTLWAAAIGVHQAWLREWEGFAVVIWIGLGGGRADTVGFLL